jgi:hypothetical protein
MQFSYETESSELCAQQVQRPARTALFIRARAKHRNLKKGDNSEFQQDAVFKSRKMLSCCTYAAPDSNNG